MPWHIETDNAECNGYAVVKDADGEVEGCHRTQAQAERQIAALYAADEATNAQDDTHDMPDGTVMAGATHGERAPAPPEDQIKGSDVNEPGSAAGAGADIELNAATETALQNKSDEHNDAMSEDDRPVWTRVTVGKLRSVYRRGSGAYSTSHRPGISRQAWSMARVNAFLYLARTGRPENPKYIGDFDLLHPDHPKAPQERAAPYIPNQEMIAEAQQGLDWRDEYNRGGTEVGVARARDIINRRNFSEQTIRRSLSFFARHEVDKDAEGFREGERGYPSAGRIAWALWGGDAGRAWANQQLKEIEAEQNRSHGKRRKEVEKILADLRAIR